MNKLFFALIAFCLVTTTRAADNSEQFCAVPFGPPGDGWSGNRQYARDHEMEVKHLALDIVPDFKKRTIIGTSIITFNAVTKPLVELHLDAVDLTIQSVGSTAKIQAWQVTDKEVIVTFEKALETNQETTVTVHYTAQPVKGLYFRTVEMGYLPGEDHFFTQGESEESRYWYPNYDFPNEKFTSEVTCHVPDGMTVLSNGRLVSEDKDANGLKSVHWSQEKPHANYLVSLVAGYFKSVEDKHNDIPLAFYVPPSEIEQAQNSFRDTKDIMEFYEQEIGVPFPWAKYYQVVARDFVAGGMENTSLTSLTDRTLFRAETENIRNSESLTSHEMAHQWFGDLVTCKDWSHLWLNEGFATFYALLYDQHKNGRESMLYGFYQTSRSITAMTNDFKPIVTRKFDDPDATFNYLPYGKGGMVLRMLRVQLGDDLYRRCIKTYLDRQQYKNVTTEDLRKVIEELSGRSYDQFFDQWVFHAHHPEIKANYSWDEKTKLAKITISQNQKLSDDVLLFNFPLTVAFKTKSGLVEKTITVKSQSEDFYLALNEAPKSVRLDPHLGLLAKIEWENLPASMLDAQLDDTEDMLGRLQAIEVLKDKQDQTSTDKLKKLLNHDTFYGVRVEAAAALKTIHTQEALEALLASTTQPDARVRLQVASSIAGFYNESALAAEHAALSKEKNPEILGQYIIGLGAYSKKSETAAILPLLEAKSYHQSIANSAITALRATDDPTAAAPIMTALKAHETEFPIRSFVNGLETIALLSRYEQNRDNAREFLLAYSSHKRQDIRLGAIKALGLLEDPRATTVLETFASASKESLEQKAAALSLVTIRAARKQPDNLKDLRDTVLDLQKQNRELKKDFDTLQKKFDAKAKSSKR